MLSQITNQTVNFILNPIPLKSTEESVQQMQPVDLKGEYHLLPDSSPYPSEFLSPYMHQPSFPAQIDLPPIPCTYDTLHPIPPVTFFSPSVFLPHSLTEKLFSFLQVTLLMTL